jgi:hypothetical protein
MDEVGSNRLRRLRESTDKAMENWKNVLTMTLPKRDIAEKAFPSVLSKYKLSDKVVAPDGDSSVLRELIADKLPTLASQAPMSLVQYPKEITANVIANQKVSARCC